MQSHLEQYARYKSYGLNEYVLRGDVPSCVASTSHHSNKGCNSIFTGGEMRVLSVSRRPRHLIGDCMDLKVNLESFVLLLAIHVADRS